MREQGITRVIIRVSPEQGEALRTLEQAEAVIDSEMELEGYVYLPLAESIPTFKDYLSRVFDIVKQVEFNRLWLDCEAKAAFDSVRKIWVAVGELHAASLGIYTRRNWWLQYTNEERDLRGFPLWDADYDNEPDLGNFTPYGGWTERFGKQYAENVPFCGTTVDLNVFRE